MFDIETPIPTKTDARQARGKGQVHRRGSHITTVSTQYADIFRTAPDLLDFASPHLVLWVRLASAQIHDPLTVHPLLLIPVPLKQASSRFIAGSVQALISSSKEAVESIFSAWSSGFACRASREMWVLLRPDEFRRGGMGHG
jgi:hypothetical protein